jgi:hypothetical protein
MSIFNIIILLFLILEWMFVLSLIIKITIKGFIKYDE